MLLILNPKDQHFYIEFATLIQFLSLDTESHTESNFGKFWFRVLLNIPSKSWFLTDT